MKINNVTVRSAFLRTIVATIDDAIVIAVRGDNGEIEYEIPIGSVLRLRTNSNGDIVNNYRSVETILRAAVANGKLDPRTGRVLAPLRFASKSAAATAIRGYNCNGWLPTTLLWLRS